MFTIRQLAAGCGLSRSTLLYYDRLGLLRPDYRTSSGQRLYNAADRARLEKICLYRSAGLSLARIARVLDEDRRPRAAVTAALNQRLGDLNREIAALRRQQQVIAGLLGTGRAGRKPTRIMDKARWVALLRAAGMDDAEMGRWHEAFERQSPEAHRDFLESLGLPGREIRRIRRASREGWPAPAQAAGGSAG